MESDRDLNDTIQPTHHAARKTAGGTESHGGISGRPKKSPPIAAPSCYQAGASNTVDLLGEQPNRVKQRAKSQDDQINATTLDGDPGPRGSSDIETAGVDQTTDDSDGMGTDNGSRSEDDGEGVENIYQRTFKTCSKTLDNTFQESVTTGYQSFQKDHDTLDIFLGSVTTERRRDQPSQSGLGTLSVFPPEIRSEIWKELFQQSAPIPQPCIYDTGDGDILSSGKRRAYRKARILSMIHTIDQPNTLESCLHGNLAILRASKQLYREIGADLYRNRTIHFCFDNNRHGLLLQRAQNKATYYYVVLGGHCVARDFAKTDFSRFKSLHLDIELPSNESPSDKLYDLKLDIGQFSRLIGAWQSRKYPKTRRHCPRIDIDIKLHKGIRLYTFKSSGSPWFELSLVDIDQLLTPLREEIHGIQDATIKVHFNVRFGQEWLPRVLYETIQQMKKSGNKKWSAYSFLTTRMCGEAYDRTRETRGSEVCGPLSKPPKTKKRPPPVLRKNRKKVEFPSDSEWSDTTSEISSGHEESNDIHVGSSQVQDGGRGRTMSSKYIFAMFIIAVTFIGPKALVEMIYKLLV
ncbi:MAG: hypothetical protein LQ337_004324 [Flavoplaca oasis]|nr:MAG: hypothetical protein LQ337_004324 [Flavoplaca oasis]